MNFQTSQWLFRLDGPMWAPLGAGTVVGANRQVSLLVSGTSFFRLRKDCPANCASNCPD